MDDPRQYHQFLDAVGDFITRFNLAPWVLVLIFVGVATFIAWKVLDAWGKRKGE